MSKSKKSASKLVATTSKPKVERKSKKGAQMVQEKPVETETPAVQAEHQESATEPAVTTPRAKKESAPKAPREERNGVKRPGPGKCLEVWEYLDQHQGLAAKDMKAVAAEKGWNVSNTQIEFYQHRKFHAAPK